MKVIMCPENHSPYLERLLKGLKKLDIDIIDQPRFEMPNFFSDIIKLSKKAIGADIIHFHWIPFDWFGMHPYFLQLCKRLNLKIVWTVHNLEPHITQYTIEKDIMSYKNMVKYSSGLIFHCKRSQGEFHKIYGTTNNLETIIPHGNFNDITPKELIDDREKFKEKSRKKLQIQNNKIALLLFPPNRWTKGIKQYVDVIRNLDENYIGIIAGKCKNQDIKTYLEQIKKQYPSKFIIHPDYLSKQKMDEYFAAADIFFMPYNKITTSGSIMTAMAYNLPIVSTNFGNLDLLVKNGENGLLCKTKEEMIDKIKKIDRETAVKMGKKSYEIADKFNWDGIAKKTEEFYRKILEKKK